MPVIDKNQPIETKLRLVWGHIDELPDEHTLRQYLPASLITELRKTVANNHLRQQCRVLAHFLLAYFLAQYHPSCAQLGTLRRTSTGRPYLAGVGNVDFNISHSGPWVAVGLLLSANQSAVAVDIEMPKPRNFSKIIQHIASADEQAWFAQQKDKTRAFYQAWCLREAVLKSQGVGIAKLHSVHHAVQTHEIITPFALRGYARFYDHLPFYLALFNQGEALPVQAFEWQRGALHERAVKSAVGYSVKPHFND
ncbi:4'-phosphopantetheinyl transferase superfamily protein [Pasteurellaceae bacterium HPA106]|uniref:4'-phosphopantetheinyl transferase family protein n=1 Tax=Spirabiliibacterium pneumoniae TaxID=221400 RepID=UPI001AAD2FBC|nr:4'-phosphopantetheinyl transferase superfamily protein [Spirabiliibacterium pneumoniae]MBE2896395.1 4'-phosphopantetheinyl transferase superfamily protein [Spirabiliibacterium pneumoniae]